MIRHVMLAVTAILLAVIATAVMARVGWTSRSAELRKELETGSPAAPEVFSAADVEGLPEPVARFFLRTLREGQPLVRAVTLVTEGDFQTGKDAAGWKPFSATQQFSTAPPGFVWDARIRMAPLMPVFVRDAYVGGHAEMIGRVMGVYPVVREMGTPELASGQLHRYLGETMWFPTALLPGHGVVWRAFDDHSAVATITDRGTTVSLRFTFTPEGDLSEVFAPDRMRSANGRHEPTPWIVRCSDHQERHGLRIPLWCEAVWQLPEGPLPYWRGRVTDVRYDARLNGLK